MHVTLNSDYRIKILIVFSIIVISMSPISYFFFVNSITPYDLGYDHGCDDARISDSSERYINQPEKGPSYHTSEFMDGYNRGLDVCSNNNESTHDNDKWVEGQRSSSSSGLKITSSASYQEDNYFYIVGEVLNTESVDKEFVKVIATLYNENNNVIGTAFTYTNPSTIPSQESSPFKIIIGESDVSSINEIKSFKIVVSDK